MAFLLVTKRSAHVELGGSRLYPRNRMMAGMNSIAGLLRLASQFRSEQTSEPMLRRLPLEELGGSRAMQTPHNGDGELHLAFAISGEELAVWEAWLAENGIVVEEKTAWDLGGQSIYFRDPDRHLIEIATPGVWSIY
jgi:catechol 2,3-dioxygenase-like lactoylglutathione lyase family enzyme